MEIKRNWLNQKEHYGHIVYLETGTGKTYIAIMLLKLIFAESKQEEELSELRSVQDLNDSMVSERSAQCMQLTPLSDEEMRAKRKERFDLVGKSCEPDEKEESKSEENNEKIIKDRFAALNTKWKKVSLHFYLTHLI
jgi:hypothetical protein